MTVAVKEQTQTFQPESFELWEKQLQSAEIPIVETEVYGRSMGIMREAGKIALQEAVEIVQGPEISRLQDEFHTAINEMLKTADGVGELVTIEREDEFGVVDGTVLAKDGMSVGELIARGAEYSWLAGETEDPRMLMQAERDEADLYVFNTFVESMFNQECAHNTVLAVSALPEDAIEKYGERFWQELGYNTDYDCAMLQMYNKVDDQLLKTRVLSIDRSNVERLATSLRSRGASVPDGVKPSDLIKHPLLTNMSYEEACEFMDELVEDYESGNNEQPKLTTTKELLSSQEQLLEVSFRSMYLPIAKSLASGEKASDLRTFIDGILPSTVHMDDESRTAIETIACKSSFDVDDARMMHGVVLYALAERLRSTIIRLRSNTPVDDRTSFTIELPPYTQVMTSNNDFILQMGGFFDQGISQGISFGGCGALFEFSKKLEDMLKDPQGVFGGKGDSETQNNEDCEFMSKKCPECGEKDVWTVVTKTHISGSCGCVVKK